MNTPPNRNDAAFDARARALHEDALGHVSARAQAQLAYRRRSASKGTATAIAPRRSLLPWAGMATAAVALVVVMQIRPPSGAADAMTGQVSPPLQSTASLQPAAASDEDTLLSEDPEFYLWLAADARPANVE